MYINFSTEETDIINDAAQYLLLIINENEIQARYEKSIKQLTKFGAMSNEKKEFSIADIYFILCYLKHFIYIEPTQFKIILSDENEKDRAQKLYIKLSNLLNRKTILEYIYIDYDQDIEEILNSRDREIIKRLGKNYGQIHFFLPIKKNLRFEQCNITDILYNDKNTILIPQNKIYLLFQYEIICR